MHKNYLEIDPRGGPTNVPAGQVFGGVRFTLLKGATEQRVEVNSLFCGPAVISRINLDPHGATSAVVYQLVHDGQITCVWHQRHLGPALQIFDRRYDISRDREAERRGENLKEFGEQSARALVGMTRADRMSIMHRAMVPGAGEEAWTWVK
ncbi:hypothetical protein LCGC14_0164150 [marine sediment metagenome]|uniref:Uncharacterized protein n=1 Tax=marine sediment metagenome TaxID=412755 RepID=A0A0F9XCT3_9ZZZZ